MVAAGHPPLPSQVAARTWVLPLQLSFRQPVVFVQGRQAPAPSQVPSLEQSPWLLSLLTQRNFGSASPPSTLAQIPPGLVLVPLHVRHSPPEAASAQAEVQQTPSVQKPLVHCWAEVHAAPFVFRPQEPFTQALGGVQSESVVQVVLHAPELQTKTPQPRLAGVVHAPLPSQVEAGVTREALAQTADLQDKPFS